MTEMTPIERTPITSKTYDEHVLFHGPQAHLDIYYEPKKIEDRRRIETVSGYLAPRAEERILDIGSGVGTFAFHAARSGAVAVGVDFSKESMKMARSLSDRYDLPGWARFVVADALQLPFSDGAFEKIAAIDFIEHITFAEKERFLAEMVRVLKNGGLAVVFTPNKIREDIGAWYWRLRHLLFKDKVPVNSLHYGLISRGRFESLLSQKGLAFEFHYCDLTRPFLARMPFVNRYLSLNLLWVVRRK